MARPKGAPNKATKAREQILSQQGLTPLWYLLQLLRDERQDLAIRIDAAKSAAPYVHPRLSSVQHQGDEHKPIVLQTIERLIVKS